MRLKSWSALQPGQQVAHRPLGHGLARLVRRAAQVGYDDEVV